MTPSLPIIAQSIGLIAYAITAYAVFHKNDQKFFSFMALGSIFWIAHFALLGSLAGAVGNFISMTRWCGARYVKRKKYRMMILATVLVAYAVTGLVTVHHWYEILPLVGSSVNSIGVFLFAGIPVRLALMFSSACWLTYGSIIGSWGGILNETTLSIINIITIIRQRKLAIPAAAQP